MKTKTAKVILLAFLAGIAGIASVAEAAVTVLPDPTADRTFQFVKISTTFMGSPLAGEALVPNVIFTVGKGEAPEITRHVTGMAFMLGQWTHDPGSSVEMVRNKDSFAPFRFDTEITGEMERSYNVVVVGKKNRFYEQFKNKLRGSGTFVEVLPDALAKGRDVMFVSDAAAAFYLANRRLYFKAGAYKGFFAFVATGLMIQQGNLEGARHMVGAPGGVKGCGKPIMLALGHKENLPKQLLKVAKTRNRLVFKDLKGALANHDKEGAWKAWTAAMDTCYSCHQGIRGVPRFRKFVPNEGEHSYHHAIVKGFGAECTSCHYGERRNRGYE